MKRLYFDGGMGTLLHERGLTEDPVRLNLTHGETIAGIHRQYLTVGATVLTANTFGAYTHKHADAAELIRAAIGHACKAGENGGYTVALDMGPLGAMLEPYGDMTYDEAYTLFAQAANTGKECGADMILIETFYCITELEAAVKAATAAGLPVFATMTFDQRGRTTMGIPIKRMAQDLAEWGVTALGMNCGLGPEAYCELLPQLLDATKLPILIQPNAGLPTIIDGKTVYNVTPEDFAKVMEQIAALADARGHLLHLGGCCGTTPAHIKAMINRCVI